MSAEKTIVIYADVPERMKFFSRFVDPLNVLGYRSHVITAKLSVYLMARKNSISVSLLQRQEEGRSQTTIDTTRSLSVLNGYHTAKEAGRIADDIAKELDMLCGDMQVMFFFIWNGTTTIARALTDFALREGIGLRFFELSNLGERVFVDIQGTNADSCLFEHPEILDRLEGNEQQYQRWLDRYLRQNAFPKQAANRTRIPWSHLVDMAGYVFCHAVREDKRWGMGVLMSRVMNRIRSHQFPEVPLDLPYVFLPLQVESDAQVKLFSNYSNEMLIDEAVKVSGERDLPLIVKVHPAEADRKVIERCISLSEEHGFILAGNSTVQLVKNAELVMVNNSTVGLQAMLFQKKVQIYGSALYETFDQSRLKKYILDYLVPIDYFGNDPIDTEVLKKVLEMDILCDKTQKRETV